MSPRANLSEHDIRQFQDDVSCVTSALERIIVGQEEVISDLVVAVLAGGHVLLEGVPGLGKTYLAKAMANSIGVSLSRVQCTPDLMPSDITGSEILIESDTGRNQRFEFRPGPVFSSIVLVDEINRAPPKTQAALLEAMQESQVTYAGTRHQLPFPFWVFATQNPIELEGTYPLPEAQLDRFLFKIKVSYPSKDTLLSMVDCSLDVEMADRMSPVVSLERIVEMMMLGREVVMATHVKQAAVDLVLATHPGRPEGSTLAQTHVRYGASPRALLTLLRAARVRALSQGLGHVSIDHLRASAMLALRHRVLLTFESELENRNIDDILEQILDEWYDKACKSKA